MKALVTGAAGFIGSHLTRELLEREFVVRGLAFPGQDTGWLEAQGVELRFGDMTEPRA